MVEVNEMEKERLKEEYRKMFIADEPVTELEIFKNKSDFHKDVLLSFGSWGVFENEIGVLKRHLREKEKFELYKTFKTREKELGETAFEKSNIEKNEKEEIQYHFGTMKFFINQVLNGETAESALYDAHEYFKSGGVLYEMEEKDKELRERILEHYESKEDFVQAYVKKFLFPPKEIRNKVGRPKKEMQETIVENVPKNKVGRPRKEITEVVVEENKPKNKVGRPRKEQIGVVTENVPKNKVGRPRKNPEEIVVVEENKPKNKVGRPRKEQIDVVMESDKPKNKVGRPRKEITEVVVEENKPKNKVGRPRKNPETDVITQENEQKNKVGRPRKENTVREEENVPKNKVGRPRKEQTAIMGNRDITLEDLISLGYVDETQVQNIKIQMSKKNESKRASTS
jgi:hypothetical protein